MEKQHPNQRYDFMKKKPEPINDHEIGRRAIGGFPGHKHIHSTGDQFCFKCNKTLREIIEKKIVNCDENQMKLPPT